MKQNVLKKIKEIIEFSNNWKDNYQFIKDLGIDDYLDLSINKSHLIKVLKKYLADEIVVEDVHLWAEFMVSILGHIKKIDGDINNILIQLEVPIINGKIEMGGKIDKKIAQDYLDFLLN